LSWEQKTSKFQFDMRDPDEILATDPSHSCGKNEFDFNMTNHSAAMTTAQASPNGQLFLENPKFHDCVEVKIQIELAEKKLIKLLTTNDVWMWKKISRYKSL
jgi:hypothetical protein